MTKTVTADMTTHLALPTTTLAWCWKITRTDGVEFFYTAHDKRLTIDGDVYVPTQGFSTTAIESAAGMAVSKSEAMAIMTADGLKAEEIRAGLFDYADVRVFLVNWANTAHGKIKMRRGWFGEVVLTPEGIFKTEVRSMAQALSTHIVEVTTSECRVDLFSTRCGLAAADFIVECTVATVINRRTFTFTFDAGGEAAPYYSGGLVKWTSGDNTGRSIEVYAHTTGQVVLFLPPGYAVGVGDTFEMWPGCDKMRATCRDKYENAINFQGEPDLPGNDQFFLYPDAPDG